MSQSTTQARNASKPVAGAEGVGDSLYPGFGNGGYDVEKYTIDLNVFDVETSALNGITTIEAKATQSLSSFNLDFIGFTVSGVLVNGQSADFSREGQELTITPEKPLKKGEDFTVEVQYSGSPEAITSVAIPVPTGWVIFDGGSFVLSEPDGAANYYPVNDHPLDKAAYTFKITVPEAFEVAANGVLEEVTDNGTTTTYVFEARDPMASYLTTVNIADDFRIDTDESESGVEIRNYFDAGIPEDLLEPFDRQADMIDFFSEIFGPYPFEVYGSVVLNTDTGTALETQTLSIFGIGQLGRADTELTVAHEVSHQWFGNDVALADWSDIWLNESIATYSEGLWVEETQGRAALDAWVTDTYNLTVEFFDFLVPPGEPPADDLFNFGVYIWGALGLHALRLEIGDDDFFETLQTYYDRYKGGNVSTEDLVAIAEEVSGQELESFFDRWIYNPYLAPIPELGLSFPGTIVGSDRRDKLLGLNSADDVIFAAGGNDNVKGLLGNDTLFGEAGEDTLYGDRYNPNAADGDDLLYGGSGNDDLYGSGGDDLLYGDEDHDKLWGGNGNDELWGGEGRDRAWGGAGSDVFVIGLGDGRDTFKDFTDGQDKIGLADGLKFGQLTITLNGDVATIRAGNDVLAIVNNVMDPLTRSDFVAVG